MKDKPNIVLIIMDTVRAKDTPMYGYEKNTMPFLNKLTKKSTLYENAYANSPWTLPSHATLFTGKITSKHKVIGYKDKLREETLAEKLKSEDYTTLGISNNIWVSNISNLNKGFEEFHYKEHISKSEEERIIKKIQEIRRSNKNYLSRIIDFCLLYLRKGKIKDLCNILKRKILSKLFFKDKGATETNKLIKEKIKKLKKEEPFFIFINYMEAHGPYKSPRKIEKKFLKNKTKKLPSRYPKEWIGEEKINKTRIKNLYDSGLYYLDSKLKELYEIFEKEDLLKDTIFVFTSDHGEFLGEKELYAHGWNLNDEVIKIPLIVSEPTSNSKKNKKAISLCELHNLILNKVHSLNEEKSEYVLGEYYGLESQHENIYEKFKGLGKKKIKKGNKYVASLISENYKFIKREGGGSKLINLEKEKEIKNKELEKELEKRMKERVGSLGNKREKYFSIKKLKNKIKKVNKKLNEKREK